MLQTHDDRKQRSPTSMDVPARWRRLTIERRQIDAGVQTCVRPQNMEMVYLAADRLHAHQIADARLLAGMVRAGTGWLVPSDTNETLLDLDGTSRCLIIFLPNASRDEGPCDEHGVEPAMIWIDSALYDLTGQPAERSGHRFACQPEAPPVAHLINRANADRGLHRRPAPTLDPRRLYRVLDYLEANFAHDIRLEDLAREACLSPFHFSRLFREATGFSPHRYVVERRVRAACSLLEAGEHPLAEIAFDCGFGSQANFCRAFLKVTGLTPRRYRERHRVNRSSIQA
ncbi:AraC family transcriptional regulator [Agrobacterium sp. SOY23]|uniref:AraC family transcriptional regulator n=1 Tax=Agrobacterium sp. SOY23 TaxID=3014555 RepID=UPI0022AFF41C|nr:AraC family transcriptional regulator [Agrobacterium sp. SOY23]MCZ4431286.1 AraC family transcriptional regulator [Agrobacterium sp. SOY23]